MNVTEEHIEIYSGNRNRLLYPLPSSFEIPFAPTNKSVQDPALKGAVYYKFAFQPCQTTLVGSLSGILLPNSTNSSFYINPSSIFNPPYIYSADYYSGYKIKLDGSDDTRIITTYDPQTGELKLNTPWTDTNVTVPLSHFLLYPNFPTSDYIFIPPTDINLNFTLNEEGIYNKYYVVFETDNSYYSNEYNSNIFYRQITYYDNVNRFAYFDEPLPFNYRQPNGEYPYSIPPQFVTLRKSLPYERWTLDKYTYINNIQPINPIIGPLIGAVITLPEGASNVDNYYKGKYVYFYSNNASGNYQSINKNFGIFNYTKPNEVFHPIYGSYYIKAYNGQTRELSIDTDINNTACTQSINVKYPPTTPSSPATNNLYNYIKGGQFVKNRNPIQVSPGVYRFNIGFPNNTYDTFSLYTPYNDYAFSFNKSYRFKWRVRKSPTMISCKLIYFTDVFGYSQPYYVCYDIENDYTIIEFTLYGTFTFNMYFKVEYLNYKDPMYIQWDFFDVIDDMIINIVEIKDDNYSPLDYTGTMVGMNQNVCYDISLCSLTLPNISLKTGSKISFYPYVYVELSNITSPNHASNQLIYSNNPNSNRALFIAPVNLLVDPDAGTFLTLYSNMIQTIKFKPNDNLKFSVYLPDGTLFETIIDDLFSPYEPDPRIQIDAVFKIIRRVIESYT